MTEPEKEIYIVTEPGDPAWDELVEMTLEQALQVEDAGYVAEIFAQRADPADVRSFEQFRADWLDD